MLYSLSIFVSHERPASTGRVYNWISMSTSDEITLLYRKYIVLVRTRASELLCGDEAAAEDVAHEVFIKFMRYIEKHPIEGSPAALLYCITHRTCVDRMRKIYRHAAAVEHLGKEEIRAPLLEDRIAIDQAVQMMKGEEARIGAAFYLDDLDLPAIAQRMHLSERTVSRRLSRFRKYIRRFLEDRREGGKERAENV